MGTCRGLGESAVKLKTIAMLSMICTFCAVALMAAEVPDDTAPVMKIKSRRLIFKADPKGLDWPARCSLTRTKTGRWIATYTQATQHGRSVPRNVVVHPSDDEGRTWSKPNFLPDGRYCPTAAGGHLSSCEN